MIKKLQKIGNSRGILLEKPLLKLLKVENDDSVEIVPHEDGLLIKKLDVQSAYNEVSKKHRKSLDKLAE
ncbi:MazE family transcriptional regulator [Rhodohalobacter barkolensis]|jgi:antitoxin component of MazEF toxin-antitoxin module|uniref:MazE family transcriptional regulator n=1 Tax=Rhodohalobacter barkolensis TaxID=2053187 RepID=A0A2N0VE57_9BACT|nr:MazE family transcriptional regulator [Rhodohalobacter barkolensis]PKD42440.1 MazE family transcriptional regulator [Rhodohalobacter barkolensis]